MSQFNDSSLSEDDSDARITPKRVSVFEMLGGSNPKSKRTTKDQDEDFRQIAGKT